jgi:O-antigen/teichoic acid export membrane protein
MESTLPAGGREAAITTDRPERPRSDSQRVLNNSVILMFRQGILWGLSGVLTIIFVPRYLGAEGLGQYQLAFSLVTIISVAIGLGSRQFIVKEVVRNHGMAAHYIGAAIGMRVLLTVVAGIVLIGIVRVAGYTVTETEVIYVAALGMVATTMAKLLSGFSHGFEDMNGPAIAEVLGKVAVVAIGIPVLILSEDVVAYTAVVSGGAFVFMLSTAYYLRNRVRISINFDRERMWTIAMGGMPFLFMIVILELYNGIDVIILRAFTNEEVTGWYGLALGFYKTIEMFPVALATALLPTLSRLHKTDTQVLAGIAIKSIGASALVIVPLAVGIAFMSRDLITFLPYPETFDNSVPLLTVLALTIPLTTFLTVLGTIAVAVDRQRAWAYALAATLGLNVAMNLVLVPLFHREFGNGGIGSAITTLSAELVMVGVGVWLMPSGVIGREMKLLIAKIALAAVVMAGISALGLLTDIWMLPFVTAGVFAYLVVVFGTRAVTVSEIKGLVDTVVKRKRGRRAAAGAGGAAS